MNRYSFRGFSFTLAALLLLSAAGSLYAQSTDVRFPTPVTTNELSGTIRARDIGDGRLTAFYYAFDGSQGDMFINVVTRNFSGDIDVFTAGSLAPLTKMVIYAGAEPAETGRLIYLRKPERLILRVQGRSPGDESAEFRIKFAGSFVALKPVKDDGPPTLDRTSETGIHVNSVGTIVDDTQPSADRQRIETITKVPPTGRTGDSRVSGSITTTTRPPLTGNAARVQNLKLVLVMRDGRTLEYPMSSLIRFTADGMAVTVVTKQGQTVRYPLLEVIKFTVE